MGCFFVFFSVLTFCLSSDLAFKGILNVNALFIMENGLYLLKSYVSEGKSIQGDFFFSGRRQEFRRRQS